jgi:hypothetical protein
MNISKKHRSWILGAALLLTVAATASVNQQDDGDIGLVHPNPAKIREPLSTHESSAIEELPTEILVDKLKRPALPEKVKDMFIAKSWYVPPPPPKFLPRPVAPPLSFHYIGKMLEEDNHSAVFLEKQSRIFVVREGDAIDTNYRVDAISPPLMTLTYLPLDIKQTVQIGEAN